MLLGRSILLAQCDCIFLGEYHKRKYQYIIRMVLEVKNNRSVLKCPFGEEHDKLYSGSIYSPSS
jgi:hypothetical protein